MKKILAVVSVIGLSLVSPSTMALGQANPFVGNWALTIPGGPADRGREAH